MATANARCEPLELAAPVERSGAGDDGAPEHDGKDEDGRKELAEGQAPTLHGIGLQDVDVLQVAPQVLAGDLRAQEDHRVRGDHED